MGLEMAMPGDGQYLEPSWGVLARELTGVSNKDVNLAKLLHDLCDRLLDLLRIGH